MHMRKLAHYSPYQAELATERVEYQPLLWSCWGREHAETTVVLTSISKRVARRLGHADHRLFLRQIRARVGAVLARRAAAMALACLPKAPRWSL